MTPAENKRNNGSKLDEESVTSSLRDFDDLEEENKRLKELLQLKLKSDTAKSADSGLGSTSNEKTGENGADKDELRKLRLKMYMGSMASKGIIDLVKS